MKRKIAWRRYSRWVTSASLLAASGCSFFYELNATQCERNSDCTALGSAFTGTVCRNRACVLVEDGGSGGGGTSGSGPGGSAGTDRGGSTSGTSGTNGGRDVGGDGGMTGEPECTTNAECIEANQDVPYVCRENACVSILTKECPLLIPQRTAQWTALEALQKYEPLFIGAYSRAQTTTPQDSLSVMPWEFALTEFNEALAGGPTVQRARRPVMAVVCHAEDTDLEVSMSHLTQELGVSGILSALDTDSLLDAFATDAATESPPLIISALNADLRLVNLDDNGLVWHTLGNPRNLAAPVVELVRRAEVLVNQRRQDFYAANMALPGVDDPSTDIRVLLVRSNDTTVSDISSILISPDEQEERPQNNLMFNTATAFDATNADNFDLVEIESVRVQPMNPDVSALLPAVRALKPHIIVAMTTTELVTSDQGLQKIELEWAAATNPIAPAQVRPFYVMSHQMVIAQDVLAAFSATFSNRELGSRIVGINYAASADPVAAQLTTAYGEAITSKYSTSPQVSSLPNTENFYDAAYYMIYSLLGTRRIDPDGATLRDSLEQRVLFGETSVNVGSTAIPTNVSRLLNEATFTMRLRGTLGPPNFNRLIGSRNSETAAWCMARVGTTGNTWRREVDVSRFDDVNHIFTGDFLPCLPNF